MIIMTREEHDAVEENEGPFTPSEAVEYLRRKKGIILTVTSLRQRRLRGTAKAKGVKKRTSLWTREELDVLEPSSKTKLVPPED